MIEATSCGGVVIYRGKILTLYKSYKHKYEGWVLPKGTVEEGEDYKDTALREVREEAGVNANQGCPMSGTFGSACFVRQPFWQRCKRRKKYAGTD